MNPVTKPPGQRSSVEKRAPLASPQSIIEVVNSAGTSMSQGPDKSKATGESGASASTADAASAGKTISASMDSTKKPTDKQPDKKPSVKEKSDRPVPDAIVVGLPEAPDQDLQRKVYLTHLWNQVSFCGPYQLITFAFTLWPNFLVGFVLLQNIFVLGKPYNRCYINNCDTGIFSDPVALSFIPMNKANTSHDECKRYTLPVDTCNTTGFNLNTTIECKSNEAVYNFDSLARSATSEWGLVCEQKLMRIVANSVFMSGMLFASLICGSLADRLGRRSIFSWAPGLLVIMGLLSANANGIKFYMFTSFFMSFCSYGMVISDFTIGVEVVPKEKRLMAGNGYPITFALGESLMTLIFYLCQNWRHGLIIISLLSTSLFIIPFVQPESIKWQIAKGGRDQHRKARTEIYRAARMNRIRINEAEGELDRETLTTFSLKPPTWGEMIKSKLMVRWVINLCFGWFFSAMTYYGVTFATENLQSSLSFYWSFIMMAFIEVPFVLSLTILMRWFGRRTLYSGSFLLTSCVALFSLALPDKSAIYMGVLTKGMISISLALSYLYTVEIFPTVSRTQGLGFCSMFARLGTIVSPFAAEIKWFGLESRSSLLLFGLICLIYGLVALDLPETKGKELPESLEDLHKLKKKKKKPS